MSARRRTRGPAQIFKKRFLQINAGVATGSSNTANIVIRETGTVYAVRISGSIFHSNTAGGVNRVWVTLQKRASGSGIIALFSAAAVNIESGDILLLKHGVVRADITTGSVLNVDEKFRYRRKVDENTVLSVVSENSTTQGTSADSIFSLDIEVWIRVR